MPTPDQIAKHPPMVDPRASGLDPSEGGRRRGRVALVTVATGVGALTGCGPTTPAETLQPTLPELVLPTSQTEPVVVSPTATRGVEDLTATATTQVEETALAQKAVQEEATRVVEETASVQATTQRQEEEARAAQATEEAQKTKEAEERPTPTPSPEAPKPPPPAVEQPVPVEAGLPAWAQVDANQMRLMYPGERKSPERETYEGGRMVTLPTPLHKKDGSIGKYSVGWKYVKPSEVDANRLHVRATLRLVITTEAMPVFYLIDMSPEDFQQIWNYYAQNDGIVAVSTYNEDVIGVTFPGLTGIQGWTGNE